MKKIQTKIKIKKARVLEKVILLIRKNQYLKILMMIQQQIRKEINKLRKII